MNERILELAIEARKYAESKPDIYSVAYDKKFAELIVRECVVVIEAGKPSVVQIPAEIALDIIGKNVKAYFGVKE